jgi:hypothetical protein
MLPFLPYADNDEARYSAAERFVGWIEERAIREARGDDVQISEVDPTGRFWLGRLGPKDEVTRPDERGDRLEPCAIGLRLRPQLGQTTFLVRVRCAIWLRERATKGDHRWRWTKPPPICINVQATILDSRDEIILGRDEITSALAAAGGHGLSAELRIRATGRTAKSRAIEITFVNSTESSDELDAVGGGRLFECSLEIANLEREPFELDTLPDSFRYDRNVEAFGVNCGIAISGDKIRTSDAPARSRVRPIYWAAKGECPDFTFNKLSREPLASCEALASEFEIWAAASWSAEALSVRSDAESWSEGMRDEAKSASEDFEIEFNRVKGGLEILKHNSQLRTAFMLMNRAMELSAKGRYDSWRPFQLAFLLANMNCLLLSREEADIVDIVWFATGGGKTETYLGLLITAALLDRMRGKLSGITAWSRFPLRLLSLQQTQRFANALAAAEIVRKESNIAGDPFSLGFLVGGAATPNRIKKESTRDGEWDADKVDDTQNPFRLLDICPFCRERTVSTQFDRRSWRLLHICSATQCVSRGEPLPIVVIDDEIWRFLPTIVVGTLDKAANIARQPGMRGLVGSPWGLCTRPGHGYTYAKRSDRKNGCLVPDCKGGTPGPLPISSELYAPTFRLQDELHLLRDSLGAVDAHYEAALDGIQEELTGAKPKILASSATLTGYKKQIAVLYRRTARVFPQPPPREGQGFWTADSCQLMRRYIALAPRRLTVEFVVDRLIVTLQHSIRRLINEPQAICSELAIDEAFADFLVNIYGTNVVYGNTLQDLDAVIRSSETQYAGLDPPPNVETLTGRTGFDNVRATLDRLEHPEERFEDRLHLIAASSMMSHGVDIDRLNIMIMLALPLGVSEFIQATARVGRRWPALVIVVPKMTRERDASVYRSFPEFVSHGDRFVEAIPITRKSRRVLERTLAGLELARMYLIHEPDAPTALTTPRNLNAFIRNNPDLLQEDRDAIANSLGLTELDEFLHDQLDIWFEGFNRNLREPTADIRFLSDLSPTGQPMLSLRDVDEQSPVSGDSSQ